MVRDPIESERCPVCGTPMDRLRVLGFHLGLRIEEWGCPECEAEAFARVGEVSP